jgi:hypothetical protein
MKRILFVLLLLAVSVAFVRAQTSHTFPALDV